MSGAGARMFTPSAVNFWDDDRTAELTRLWSLGFSASQVAKQIGNGVSRSAVIGKVFRLKLTVRSAEVVAAALTLGNRQNGPPKRRLTSPPVKRAPSANAGLSFGTRKFAYKPANIPEPTPVDAGHAKPWIERTFGECAAPISGHGADTMSCCAPAKGSYCKPHMAAFFVKPATSAKDLTRMAVRAAA